MKFPPQKPVIITFCSLKCPNSCHAGFQFHLPMRVSPCSCWVMFASFPGDHPHSASWKQSLRCNQVGVADRKPAHLGKTVDMFSGKSEDQAMGFWSGSRIPPTCYGFLNELKTQKAKEQIGRTTTSSSWFGFTLPAGHRACPTSGWHCYDAWIGQQFSHTSHAGCEYAHLSTEYVSLESLDFFLKIYLNHTSVAWDGNQVGNRSRGHDLKSINDVFFFKNTYVVNVCSSNGKSLPNFCVNMKKHSWSHSASELAVMKIIHVTVGSRNLHLWGKPKT